MIGAGEPLPAARVWAGRDDEPGTVLRSLADDGPFLLLVYLWDWTST